MSYYGTPRRRHSSLFQRMQNQIKKISQKLSAAKQSYSGSTAKPKHNHFMSYNSVQDRNPPTVRKSQETAQLTLPLKYHTAYIRKRGSSNHAPPPQTLHLEQTFLQKQSGNVNKIILKLHNQNSKLSYQLGKMEAICEDQSYKIGYIKAQLKQTNKKLTIQKQKQLKQTSYLVTLLEHYKSKAKKYKKALRHNSQVSIDLGSDSNV